LTISSLFALLEGAQALITPSCLVKVTLDGSVQTGCATYNATTDTFQHDLKTAQSTAVGNHTLGIQVSAPDNLDNCGDKA